MLTIGFTTVYYTLWDVNSFQKCKVQNGEVKWFLCTSHQYLRNLSHDLDKAKEKVMSLGPNTQYVIDLALHGTKWFEIEREIRVPGQEHDYTFSFGRYKGRDILTAGQWYVDRLADPKSYYTPEVMCDEYQVASIHSDNEKGLKDVVWQLDRAMRMESTARRKVYARRRLIELGELIRRDWTEKIPWTDPEDPQGDDPYRPMYYKEFKRKWMPRGLAKWHDEIGSKKGIFYTDKKRMTFTLKELKSKMVNTEYGTMYIVDYLDSEGHILTYKGGSPVRVPKGETFEATATIKHVIRGEYKNTFIQRLKIKDEQVIS